MTLAAAVAAALQTPLWAPQEHGRLQALQALPGVTTQWIWALLAMAGLALAIVLAIALARVQRRALFASSREIVRAAEELAEGRYDRMPTLAADDPLLPAASALAKLTGSIRQQTLEIERRLRLLEEILQTTHDTVIVITDGGGDVRYASPAAEALFGWKPGEAVGERLESLFEDVVDFEGIVPKLSRRSLREAALTQWARLRRRGAEPFRAELKITAFHNLPGSGGEGFLFEIRDLSGEEALRAELKESEEKHRTLVERLPLGVFVVQDGRIAYSNSALSEILDVSQESLTGSEFRDHLAAEDLLHVLDRVRGAESGADSSLEMDCRLRPAGSRWPIEVILSASRIVYGGRPAVIGTVRDVGPDRGLLRQLRLSEAKLDAALGASEEAVLLLGAAPAGGSVALANRRFEELTGLEAHALAGLSLAELCERLAPLFADPAGVRRFLTEFQASSPALAGAVFETAGAPRRTIEFSSRVARDRDGRVIGRVVSALDITPHREHERRLAREAEELARTRDLLEHANRELSDVNRQLSARSSEIEKANQELRTLDEMKSNLLANVSHELQTPLVSIKGYTEMILKGRLGTVTEEQKKGLEVSLRNIDRLIGMINNLLNFSRLEKDMAGMIITTFPLPALVDETIDLVHESAEARRVSLSSRYLTDEVEVKADRDKIGQVFVNLLANAVKYNRDGGQVQVDVRKGKKGYLIVDVRDTGIGIPRESLEKIFDRFYRVSEEPTGAAGSGIGLAIVRDILRMHGCIIKADSTLGEGTVFTFTLPIAPSGRESEGANGPSGAAGEPSPRGSFPTTSGS